MLIDLVDANYKFICIDLGAYGRNSDGGIFAHSSLGNALTNNKLNLPKESCLEGAAGLSPLPYVVVGYEAFPLQTNLMKPYTRLSGQRLSR